jgi:SAM-dependent methyltransferase
VLDPGVFGWIRSRLPAAPARLLEVGAGAGELAAALSDEGYEVVAIDPGGGEGEVEVEPIALAELEAPVASFEAAVAVVSLHHVQPLAESLEALARAVRPHGTLLVDEFDAELFDERAAAWLIERRGDGHGEHIDDPAELVTEIRGHVHPVSELRAELDRAGFELEPILRGAYLHRWDLPLGYLADEQSRIDAGELPAVGVRFAAMRR